MDLKVQTYNRYAMPNVHEYTMNYHQFATTLEPHLKELNRDQKKLMDNVRMQSEYNETMQSIHIEQTDHGKNALRAYWVTASAEVLMYGSGLKDGVAMFSHRKTILVHLRDDVRTFAPSVPMEPYRDH